MDYIDLQKQSKVHGLTPPIFDNLMAEEHLEVYYTHWNVWNVDQYHNVYKAVMICYNC